MTWPFASRTPARGELIRSRRLLPALIAAYREASALTPSGAPKGVAVCRDRRERLRLRLEAPDLPLAHERMAMSASQQPLEQRLEFLF